MAHGWCHRYTERYKEFFFSSGGQVTLHPPPTWCSLKLQSLPFCHLSYGLIRHYADDVTLLLSHENFSNTTLRDIVTVCNCRSLILFATQSTLMRKCWASPTPKWLEQRYPMTLSLNLYEVLKWWYSYGLLLYICPSDWQVAAGHRCLMFIAVPNYGHASPGNATYQTYAAVINHLRDVIVYS